MLHGGLAGHRPWLMCTVMPVDRRDAETAKGLTLDEARRIESNIAKLTKLLGKD
jgi:hypothetical protein